MSSCPCKQFLQCGSPRCQPVCPSSAIPLSLKCQSCQCSQCVFTFQGCKISFNEGKHLQSHFLFITPMVMMVTNAEKHMFLLWYHLRLKNLMYFSQFHKNLFESFQSFLLIWYSYTVPVTDVVIIIGADVQYFGRIYLYFFYIQLQFLILL